MPTELKPAPTKKFRTSGRLAEDELVVRREALGPVVELADPGLLEGRDAEHRALHQQREVVPVLLEQLELERVGDLVGRHPRLRLGLEPADDQPADLLLEVGVAVGVAQHRQVGVHALDRLGHDVEVLGGVQRHGDPGQGADLLGPLAGAVDDDLGLDVAGVGAHAGHAPVARPARRGPGCCSTIRAPLLPGAPGQRLRSGRSGWPCRRRAARSRRRGRRPASPG